MNIFKKYLGNNIANEDRYFFWETFFMAVSVFSEPFFFFFLLYFNIHLRVQEFAQKSSSAYILTILISLTVFALINWIIYFPLSFLRSYYLDKKFDLSNQTFLQWFKDNLKTNLLKGLLILIIVIFIYIILSKLPDIWWIISFIFTTGLYVFLAFIAPVVIFPLFFKFTPIENEELKNRLMEFINNLKLKIRIENIYQVDLSKKSNTANAAMMGMGKTKRVAFSDTLLDQFSPDEIESVLAHELGHLVNRHHTKASIISAVFLFIFFFSANLIIKSFHTSFGITNIADPSSIPFLALIFSAEGIILLPFLNHILRQFEYSADKYSAEVSTNPEALIEALEKLAAVNLIKKEPSQIVEALFYSHPSVQKRIDYIRSIIDEKHKTDEVFV